MESYSSEYVMMVGYFRICQGLVLKKASLAELVFSHLLGDLAARNESDSELCKTISKQVS
jgi:hypothetical protein